MPALSAMRRIMPAVAVFALIALYLLFDTTLLSLFAPGNDWAPVWTAGRLAWTNSALVYDFSLVSSMQQPLLGQLGERPFTYPPSALLFFAPFALLPFRLSLIAWIVPSVLLFERMSLKLGARPVLLVMAPPVFLAVVAGQPTLFVSALLIAALCLLPVSQHRAGALLAICAVIKPTLLILAPVALCAGGHWRALWTAGATAAALCLASLVLFGLRTWQLWFTALARFQSLVSGFEPLARNSVTPYATALRLGVNPAITVAFFGVIAIAIIFISFSRNRDPSLQLVALVGGALLISPYAMDYELATLAPAVVVLSIRRMRDVLLPALWGGSLFFNAGVVGLLAVYAWAAARLIAELSQSRTMERCSSGSTLPPESTATVPSIA